MIPFILSLVCLCTPPVSAAAPISTSEAVEYLRALEQKQEGRELNFCVCTYYGTGTALPPDTLPSEALVLRTRVSSLTSDGRYRHSTTHEEVSPQYAGLKGALQTATWDGREARLLALHVSGEANGRIDNLPQRDVRESPVNTYCGSWAFQLPYSLGFADLLSSATILSGPYTKGGLTEWVLENPIIGESEIRLALSRSSSGSLHLVFAEQSCFAPTAEAPKARRLIVLSRIDFSENEDATTGLPLSARLVHCHFREDSRDAFWGASDMHFTGSSTAQIASSMFRLPFDTGCAVVDTRINVAYRIGSNLLNLNGRVLQTSEPIQDGVAEQLPSLVQKGRFNSPPPTKGAL